MSIALDASAGRGLAASAGGERRTLLFAGAVLAACLFLQRFGVPLGGKSASIVGPIGLVLAGWGVFEGVLAFDRRRLGIFLFLTAWVVLAMAWHAMSPGQFGTELNLPSVAQFVLLTGFVTLSFAEPVDEARFFRLVTGLLMIVALAGVLQFALQFAGVQVFAFTGLLPDAILFEYGYNVQIPSGVGNLFKSNGFFLIEPSVFSQFMALGAMIEILTFKRLRYLAAFAAGLLLSMSGTGWIVLAAFIVATGIGMGGRGIAIAVLTVAVVALVVGVGSVAAPELAAAVGERMSEISRPGTSGHARFVTPFWLLDDILTAQPSASVVGIGSGASERQSFAYSYDVNTPIKIWLEYGLPVLVAYVLLFLVGRRTAIQAALVTPSLVLVLFTGGYQQFPPVLFPIMLVICVAQLRPSPSLG